MSDQTSGQQKTEKYVKYLWTVNWIYSSHLKRKHLISFCFWGLYNLMYLMSAYYESFNFIKLKSDTLNITTSQRILYLCHL